MVIARLEEKRYIYRQRAGLSRKTLKVERELERLYSFDALKRDVKDTLSGARVGRKTTSEVIALIESDERQRSEAVGRLRDAIAVYQGHATLGKIINIVLHEGRRPLSYFRNQYPLLRRASEEIAQTQDLSKIPKIAEMAEGIADNAADFVALFGRLDPLAAQRRLKKKPERFGPIVRRAIDTFSGEMDKAGITCIIECDETLVFPCWRQDIHAIFTNLVDNSLYWLRLGEFLDKHINIRISSDGEKLLHIDYTDNGPGIEPEHIETGVIFDPQFSTKPEGMGLGLAIAGEAATRNGLELTALEHDGGAWFRLEPV